MATAAAGASGPVLPWMRVPITIEAGSGVPIGDVLGLDPRLASELLAGSRFRELFPVQAAVWQHSGGGCSTAHDLCVAAPTGSGKTLAYALPVVNALAGLRGGGRLRALVVLPTRDLAAQVYDVFRPLCEAVGLRAALAAARSSEAAEAVQLVGVPPGGGAGGGGGAACGGGGGGADVVVATPGRLMAHLSGTPGFTLRHLRFLVVDETDRLLRQSYQEWLPRVLAQLGVPAGQPQGGCGGAAATWAAAEGASADQHHHHHFAARWPAAIPGTALPFAQPRVVKIIVSATLTRDPAKLQRLALHHPRFVATAAAAGAAGGAARYSLPRSLSEYRLLCSAARKPLALLALLSEAAGQSTIVFTSSLEMTHKLFIMLRAVPSLPDEVVEYSSLVPVKERAAALERFRSGSAKVLVASDAMTRGMDVDCVQNVINYDAPVYAKTYVHRAGRTARAGKAGRVITLLRDEDMRHFKAMLRKADNNFVRDYRLPPERVESFRPALAGALQQLEELLAAERRADQQQQQPWGQQPGAQKRAAQQETQKENEKGGRQQGDRKRVQQGEDRTAQGPMLDGREQGAGEQGQQQAGQATHRAGAGREAHRASGQKRAAPAARHQRRQEEEQAQEQDGGVQEADARQRRRKRPDVDRAQGQAQGRVAGLGGQRGGDEGGGGRDGLEEVDGDDDRDRVVSAVDLKGEGRDKGGKRRRKGGESKADT